MSRQIRQVARSTIGLSSHATGRLDANARTGRYWVIGPFSSSRYGCTLSLVCLRWKRCLTIVREQVHMAEIWRAPVVFGARQG